MTDYCQFSGLKQHNTNLFSNNSGGWEPKIDLPKLKSLVYTVGEGEGVTNWESYIDIWASLVARMVKNPPAMQETWIWSLGWEDPLEEGMASHPSILA